MRHLEGMHKLTLAAFVATSALLVITGTIWGVKLFVTHQHQAIITTQPVDNAIGGFPLSGQLAPDFSLTDQFGQAVTLSALRGHEVVMAFIDSRCTSLCPLTSQIMYTAKTRLQAAASRVELVAVNANPNATSINEVQAWSIKHGMLHQWLFLTGPATQLQSVYRLYQVYVQVNGDGSIVHDTIMFIIDANGRERLSFETLDSNNQSDLGSEESGLEAGMKQWLPQLQ